MQELNLLLVGFYSQLTPDDQICHPMIRSLWILQKLFTLSCAIKGSGRRLRTLSWKTKNHSVQRHIVTTVVLNCYNNTNAALAMHLMATHARNKCKNYKMSVPTSYDVLVVTIVISIVIMIVIRPCHMVINDHHMTGTDNNHDHWSSWSLRL